MLERLDQVLGQRRAVYQAVASPIKGLAHDTDVLKLDFAVRFRPDGPKDLFGCRAVGNGGAAAWKAGLLRLLFG